MITIDGIIFSIQKNGGISVYFKELLHYLAQQGAPSKLQLFQNIDLSNKPPFEFCDIHKLPYRFQERYRKCPITTTTGVFHSSYYREPENALIPSVVTVHDFVYERYVRGFRRWVHSAQKFRAIRSAQAIICISQSTKSDLLEFSKSKLDEERIHVVYNGVSNDFYRQDELADGLSSRPFILFVGQRGGYKNFSAIVQALQFLPDFELWCVGGGSFSPNELSGVPESIRNRIRHRGFPSNQELNVYYNKAFCLAYPSAYEGFGIPVIEAMRAGCPVVSADCKAVIEVGGDALTVAIDADPHLLGDCILKLHSTHYRDSVIQAGILNSQKYSWQKCHSKTVEIYKSMGAIES